MPAAGPAPRRYRSSGQHPHACTGVAPPYSPQGKPSLGKALDDTAQMVCHDALVPKPVRDVADRHQAGGVPREGFVMAQKKRQFLGQSKCPVAVILFVRNVCADCIAGKFKQDGAVDLQHVTPGAAARGRQARAGAAARPTCRCRSGDGRGRSGPERRWRLRVGARPWAGRGLFPHTVLPPSAPASIVGRGVAPRTLLSRKWLEHVTPKGVAPRKP